jgi:hypothetical protein
LVILSVMAAIAFGGSLVEAAARDLSMTCTNPRRGYSVKFDAARRSFITVADGSRTSYQVHSYTASGRQIIVSGLTMDGGPRFTAYFGTHPRIEFNSGSDIQTDYCR